MNKARERVIDELLVMRCQAGSRESFDLLIRRWQHRLWVYARHLAGSDDAAWDVMQETWVAVFGQIRKLSDPAWFAVWVHRIVRNKYTDRARRARRDRLLVSAAAWSRRVDYDSASDDRAELVAIALRRLPGNQRELLTLKYCANLNLVEIAVVLDVPVGTVKSRLHTAREALRRILKGYKS